MRIEAVEYQKEKNGPWLVGILINEGDGPLLDTNGNPVGEVWDYRQTREYVLTVPDVRR